MVHRVTVLPALRQSSLSREHPPDRRGPRRLDKRRVRRRPTSSLHIGVHRRFLLKQMVETYRRCISLSPSSVASRSHCSISRPDTRSVRLPIVIAPCGIQDAELPEMDCQLQRAVSIDSTTHPHLSLFSTESRGVMRVRAPQLLADQGRTRMSYHRAAGQAGALSWQPACRHRWTTLEG